MYRVGKLDNGAILVIDFLLPRPTLEDFDRIVFADREQEGVVVEIQVAGAAVLPPWDVCEAAEGASGDALGEAVGVRLYYSQRAVAVCRVFIALLHDV